MQGTESMRRSRKKAVNDEKLEALSRGTWCRVASCLLLLVCTTTGLEAYSADAKKDPKGWDRLQFGMTPEAVLRALGDDAYIEPAAPQKGPFYQRDGLPDLKEVAAFVGKTLKELESLPEQHQEVAAKACRAMIRELRSRKWASYRNNMEPAKSVTGKPIDIHRGFTKNASFVVGSRLGLTTLNVDLLTPPSKAALDRVLETAAEVSAVAKDIQETQAPKEELIPALDAGRIRVKSIEVRGTKFVPKLTFKGNKLTEVSLWHGVQAYWEDNVRARGGPGAHFDWYGCQQTMVDELCKTYGKWDELNKSGTATAYLWKFPKTIIKCYGGSATDCDFMGISYEQGGSGKNGSL